MLRPYHPSLAPEVARLYNEMIAPVPYTYPVPTEWFADLVALRSVHYEHPEQDLMVAEEGGRVVGFVNVAAPPPARWEDWYPAERTALIRCLAYRPGQRRIGQELLEWAEAWARGRGDRRVSAWHALFGYPCQSPWTHLSDHIGHVRALFGMAGYRPGDGQLYFVWQDYAPPEPVRPELEFEAKTERRPGKLGGTRLTIRAVHGEAELGRCVMERGHASPRPDAQDWCYCDDLAVEEAVQGRRLGVYLLTLGLQEMHRAGCRHAVISTGGDNYRAALLYTNLGYRHVDYSSEWRKDLSGAAAEAK
jgi:GNAT superfamily N-acetyltransferase